MDDARPHRGERVEALPERELLHRRLELRAAAGDVVERRDAADRSARLPAVRPVRPPPDDHRDLALPVGTRLLARDDDLLAVADQRVRPDREAERAVGAFEARPVDVRLVVDPDRDDLLRPARREQPNAVEPVALAPGALDRLPCLVAPVEPAEAGRPGVDDMVALQAPEPRPAALH